MNKLLFCDFFHFGDAELVMISFTDPGKILYSIVVSKVIVRSVKPFSFFHFFKRVGILIGIVLNYSL